MSTTEARDFTHFTRAAGQGRAAIDLAIEGGDCASCLDEIENALKRLPGVEKARLNLTTRRLGVTWCGSASSPASFIDELARLGFRAYPFEAARAEAEAAASTHRLLKCLAVAGFAAMNIMLLSVSVWAGNASDMTSETRDFFHWLSALIALPAAAYAGQPFFANAAAGLRARRLNMDVPISLGILLALGMSVVETARHAAEAYFDSAVMLLLFLLAGRTLEQAMRGRTRAAAGNLAALKGEVAHRLDENGALVTVPVAALQPDDQVFVRPGERIPADGRVRDGASEIDESPITGETTRRAVGRDAFVHAGSMNFDGALTLDVKAAGEATLIDEIARLVDAAGAARGRYRRLADRAARFYAPVVHATAICTAIVWLAAGASLHDALVTAISVLIITCPCALALAVPVVQVVASGALFRAGIFLNSGEAIERLAEIDHVVFDKTGTLTLPEPRVANAGEICPELLESAGRLALSSHHPLAAAVARQAAGLAPFAVATEVAGQGVSACVAGEELRLGSAAFCDARLATAGAAEADGKESHLFFRKGDEVTRLVIEQDLRVDAGAIVARLRERGLGLTILSGDRPSAVAPVAAALAVTDWQGGLAPAEKIARLAALKAAGRRVLMVGDGLNDAPALAAAHCSLSPVTAGALAQAQADAVFLGERLAPVAEAIDLARRARALMQANLLMAVAYNAIAVPLAVAGLLTPLIAAAAMSGSSILVTLNALRAGREHTRRSGGRMRQVFGAPLLPLAGQGVTCNVTDEGRAVASIGAE